MFDTKMKAYLLFYFLVVNDSSKVLLLSSFIGGGNYINFHIGEDSNFHFFRLMRGREERSIGTLAPLLRYLKKPRLWPQQECQKAMSLINEQNNNVACVACFLYISLSSLHNDGMKWPNFKFSWERERQGDKFHHLCLNSGAFPSLQLQPKFSSSK